VYYSKVAYPFPPFYSSRVIVDPCPAWSRAALWQVWRCGIPEIGNEVLAKFCERLQLSLEEFVETLAEEGLIDVLPKLGYRSENLTFLKLTDKGRKLVYEDEGSRWLEKISEVSFEEPGGRPKEAYNLTRTMTLAEAGKVLKRSRETVSGLSKRYVREMERYRLREAERQAFLSGERGFGDLRIEVLGDFSVRTANILHRAKVFTVPGLLETTETFWLRQTNFGRKSLKEINARLELYGATRLEFGYWDVNSLRSR
jgi:hypothetical protein